MIITLIKLQKLCQKILIQKGYSAADAKTISHILLDAELRGKSSQGIAKLLSPIAFVANSAATKIEIKKTKNSVVVEGNGQNGMVVAEKAIQELLKIAKKYPISMAATNGTTSSLGVMGYYTSLLAEKGFVGIAIANSPAFVAPYNAQQPFMGTNPMAIAFPSNSGPLVLDMSTSEISMFEVMRSMQLNQELPENVALDQHGKATRLPNDVLNNGSLLPFKNSHKASGLSLMIELLAGIFVGASSADTNRNQTHGALFLALSEESFVDKAQLQNNLGVFLEKYHSLASHSGSKLHFPGEKAIQLKKQGLEEKHLKVPHQLIQKLLELAGEK